MKLYFPAPMSQVGIKGKKHLGTSKAIMEWNKDVWSLQHNLVALSEGIWSVGLAQDEMVDEHVTTSIEFLPVFSNQIQFSNTIFPLLSPKMKFIKH